MLIPNNQESDCIFAQFQPPDQQSVHDLILAGLADHWGTIDLTLNRDLDDIYHNYSLTGAYVLVVTRQHRIIGTGMLVAADASMVIPNSTEVAVLPYGRIVRMSVERTQRRSGIGVAIIEQLMAVARARHYSAVVIETNNDWYDAIGLYHKAGFSEYARDDESVYLVRRLAGNASFDISLC